MDLVFATPQRQSPIGIVVMFFDAIQEYARALGPLLIVFFFKFSDTSLAMLILGIVALFVFLSVIAYLKYRNFTFLLDESAEEFIVTEGVFNKTRTTIQLRKIQQVDIKQNLIQRIIGVYTLDVDTAGTSNQEVAIRAISHPMATALKARLLDNERHESIENDSAIHSEPATKPFIKISFASLFKVGITSNYLRSLGILMAFFASTYENIHRVSEGADLDRDQFRQYFNQSVLMQSVAIVILGIFAVVLIINLGRIVIRYFNYTIARQSGSLLLSFGLINTRSTILKPEKVQIFSHSQNYFQKKLDVTEVNIREATGGEGEKRSESIEIPGCDARERDAIMTLLFGKIPQRGFMLTPNFRKLGFSIFLTIVLPLCAYYAIASYAEPLFFAFNYAVAAYVIFMLVIQYFNFRNHRLFIADDFIIKQSGAWDIKNEIIEPNRIQALTASQLFWHKGPDIGYLTIHTAGGNLSFQLGNFTKIRHYINLWLYEMERSDSNWN